MDVLKGSFSDLMFFQKDEIIRVMARAVLDDKACFKWGDDEVSVTQAKQNISQEPVFALALISAVIHQRNAKGYLLARIEAEVRHELANMLTQYNRAPDGKTLIDFMPSIKVAA